MFYNNRASLDADFPGFEDKSSYGRNSTDSVIGYSSNLHKQGTDCVGGFTSFAGTCRLKQDEGSTTEAIGAGFKEAMSSLGGWRVYMYL